MTTSTWGPKYALMTPKEQLAQRAIDGILRLIEDIDIKGGKAWPLYVFIMEKCRWVDEVIEYTKKNKRFLPLFACPIHLRKIISKRIISDIIKEFDIDYNLMATPYVQQWMEFEILHDSYIDEISDRMVIIMDSIEFE